MAVVENLSEIERDRFNQIWEGLNANQRKLAIAMLDYPTKKEAAESVELAPQTAYKWNGIISEAVDLLRKDKELAALAIIGQALPKAAYTKVEGLGSFNERIRQDVATEILDRHLGKPGQYSNITVNNQVLVLLKGYHDLAE